MKGLFITFEGLEGGGKTTVLKMVTRQLKELDYPVVETREPGGTEFSERAREQLFAIVGELLATSYIGPDTLPESYISLWFQAQASTVSEVIKPSLENGNIVLCDRFSDTPLAFFWYGAKRNLDEILRLNETTTQEILPDMTLWFDLPLELGLTRKGYINNPKQGDFYKERTLDFYREVEKGYHQLFESDNSNRWRRIDATKTVGVVKDEALKETLKGIHLRKIKK